jgi:hypothetical protein
MHTAYTDALIAAHAKDSVHTLTFHKGAVTDVPHRVLRSAIDAVEALEGDCREDRATRRKGNGSSTLFDSPARSNRNRSRRRHVPLCRSRAAKSQKGQKRRSFQLIRGLLVFNHHSIAARRLNLVSASIASASKSTFPMIRRSRCEPSEPCSAQSTSYSSSTHRLYKPAVEPSALTRRPVLISDNSYSQTGS